MTFTTEEDWMDALWQAYPLKRDKAVAMRALRKIVKTHEDADAMKRAIENYAADCRANPWRAIMYPATFWNPKNERWKEWLPSSPPSAAAGVGQGLNDRPAWFQKILEKVWRRETLTAPENEWLSRYMANERLPEEQPEELK